MTVPSPPLGTAYVVITTDWPGAPTPNMIGFEVPATGSKTVTLILPAEPKRLPGMDALNRFAEMKFVATELPFHRTVDELVKPETAHGQVEGGSSGDSGIRAQPGDHWRSRIDGERHRVRCCAVGIQHGNSDVSWCSDRT